MKKREKRERKYAKARGGIKRSRETHLGDIRVSLILFPIIVVHEGGHAGVHDNRRMLFAILEQDEFRIVLEGDILGRFQHGRDVLVDALLFALVLDNGKVDALAVGEADHGTVKGAELACGEFWFKLVFEIRE